MTTIPVLAYHKIAEPSGFDANPNTCVTPEAFAAQMRLLKRLGYATPEPAEYQKARLGLPARLPRKPVLITFDDAFASVPQRALQVMKPLGFTGAVFMVSSAFGGAAFWDGEPPTSPNRLLTAAELRGLLAEGWAVGSHGVTHRDFRKLDAAGMAAEARDSKAALEKAAGAAVDWFAYPYGGLAAGASEAAAAAGYTLAFATEAGRGGAYAVPRRIISGRCGLARFWLRLQQAGRLARL